MLQYSNLQEILNYSPQYNNNISQMNSISEMRMSKDEMKQSSTTKCSSTLEQMQRSLVSKKPSACGQQPASHSTMNHLLTRELTPSAKIYQQETSKSSKVCMMQVPHSNLLRQKLPQESYLDQLRQILPGRSQNSKAATITHIKKAKSR